MRYCSPVDSVKHLFAGGISTKGGLPRSNEFADSFLDENPRHAAFSRCLPPVPLNSPARWKVLALNKETPSSPSTTKGFSILASQRQDGDVFTSSHGDGGPPFPEAVEGCGEAGWSCQSPTRNSTHAKNGRLHRSSAARSFDEALQVAKAEALLYAERRG